ncbi:MAG: hypothetical protein HUK00_08440 [Bacteroidaceae bacterium]|nr:hypothetical protein [Bacteroidaceae bacterium]
MKKSTLIASLGIFVVVALVATVVYLLTSLQREKEENALMVELAEMDKLEMENQYEEFARQYSELQTQITNDSLIAQLEQEQERTRQLLDELRRTKANDAAEITRLKKELATLRQILRGYVHDIDSLNQLNQQLMAENAAQGERLAVQAQNIQTISAERESLAEKVTIAAQLDATGISVTPLNRKDKAAKKVKDFKKFAVSFRIARNITAQPGNRTIYLRILTPGGQPLSQGGTFAFEDRNIEYSARKTVEYGGEELALTMYYDIVETLQAGRYQIQIFADGNCIGQSAVTFEQ